MSKQKEIKNENSIFQLTAAHLGAWALVGLTVVGASEMILEHQSAVNPAAGHGSSEQVARAEGRGESARMPEEFDIGLQTTSISGL